MMNDTSQTTNSQDRVIPDKDIVMKTCTYCEVPKPLDEFKKTRSAKDGYQSYCKACTAMMRYNQTPGHRERYARRIKTNLINARHKARRLELKQEAKHEAKLMAKQRADEYLITAKLKAKQRAAEYLITAKLIHDSGLTVSHSQAKALVIAWTDDRLAQLKDMT